MRAENASVVTAHCSLMQLVLPNAAFDATQCEWLLDCMELRSVCKSAQLDWQNLGHICLQWLQTNDVMGSILSLLKREDFPLVYNAFRASLVQRYALRAAQKEHDAIIAGSYPAALFLQKEKRSPKTWCPGDIDVWIPHTLPLQAITQQYMDILQRVGVAFQDLSNEANEYPSDSDTSSDDFSIDTSSHAGVPALRHIRKEHLTMQQLQQTIPEVLSKRVFEGVSADFYNDLLKAVARSGADLHLLGHRRAYDIQECAKIRVNGQAEGAKSWWVHIKDFNVIKVNVRTLEWSAAAICSSFDLSCCCVAMHVDAHLAATYSFYQGSRGNLQDNCMTLLPCSFSTLQLPVTTQLHRIKKYALRGFHLISTDDPAVLASNVAR